MEEYTGHPELLSNLRNLLEPYIKPRQEATRIRRILRLHLTSYLQTENHQVFNRPLSLPDSSISVEGSPQKVKEFQREYFRCINSNFKARNEYAQLSKEHRIDLENETFDADAVQSLNHREAISTQSFIDLARKRHRRRRLCIIQEYVDVLSQKPAASIDYLDPANVLKGFRSLPKVPLEVMQPTSIDRVSTEENLKSLVSRLEKSVLRSKIVLAREQKLLLKIRAEQPEFATTRATRLSALGATRDELIKWIEAELVRAGELSISGNESAVSDCNYQGLDSNDIDANLKLIRKQYLDYVNTRQILLACLKGNLEEPSFDLMENTQMTKVNEGPVISDAPRLLHPYLHELLNFADEQKGFVQQKAHLKANLAKQLNEASQGLDRLAQESHLLTKHPIPPSNTQLKRKDVFSTFTDQASNQEIPVPSCLALAWIYATQAATQTTTEAVLEKVEEGGLCMLEAQNHLLHLESLLGVEIGEKTTGARTDTWAGINGNLSSLIKGNPSNIS